MESQELKFKLNEQFGHSQFRGDQEKIIQSCLSGQDSLVIMPTGTGKSLCYQLPSALFSGVTLVVSPLIALMKDQVDAALKKGLKVCFINSSLSTQERDRRYKKLSLGEYQLVYITPERFQKEVFWEALRSNKISLLAIDEAHCITDWGHDFRPEYSRLGEIRQQLLDLNSSRFPTMALTATATVEAQAGIIKQLCLNPEVTMSFVQGVARENLDLNFVNVVGLDEKVQRFIGLRHQYPGPCIVYFALISSLEKFAQEISRLGEQPLIYHGQMHGRDRKQHQEEFLQTTDQVILATPAFGLGVDKPDIRMVLHAEVPSSIEAYYQEVGRAGRDGRPSHCYLFYDQDDISIQMDFIKWTNPGGEFIRQVYRLIETRQDKIQTEGIEFLRQQMNFYNSRDFRVETALNLLERWGAIGRRDKNQPLAVITEPPEEYLDESIYQKRLKRQNEKLLQMVYLAQSEEEVKPQIYKYFET